MRRSPIRRPGRYLLLINTGQFVRRSRRTRPTLRERATFAAWTVGERVAAIHVAGPRNGEPLIERIPAGAGPEPRLEPDQTARAPEGPWRGPHPARRTVLGDLADSLSAR